MHRDAWVEAAVQLEVKEEVLPLLAEQSGDVAP